jgi:CRP/FNR family transcriptional regulator, cyclic AMP receptor protein
VDRSRVAPISALSGCPDEELDAVARVASEREFADGETLMSEGDFGHSLFLVESGSADVLVHGEKVREVGPGEVVGEVAVLASGRRSASVIATSPVRVIAFFKPDVWDLERNAPEASRRLRAAMEEHVASPPESSSDE